MEFPIETFATWFCFVFCTGKSSPEEDEYFFDMPITTKRIKDIIKKLLKMYQRELSSAFKGIEGDFAVRGCYESYLKGILSKCTELSESPDELRFLLACTFIYGIVSPHTDDEMKCFRFSKMASIALVAVYDEYYKDLLDSESFETYCINLNTDLERRLTAEGRRKLKPFNEEELEKIMAHLDEPGDDDLSIEETMLIDLTEFLPSDYYPAKAGEGSSSEESSEESYKSTEDSGCKNRICKHCRRDCFGFASAVV